MKITQAMIAKRLGVCQSTVSQALSETGYSAIPHITRERIVRVARELGYQRLPSYARQPMGKTKNIAFLVPEDFQGEELEIYTRRFYAGVLRELDTYGYHLVQAIAHADEELPDVVRDGDLAGVIYEDRCDPDLVQRIQARMPIVLLNNQFDTVDVDSVMPDNAGGYWKAIHHLYQLGHRRIALFGMYPPMIHLPERIDAYRNSLIRLDLPIQEDYITIAEPQIPHSLEDVAACAKRTLQEWMRLATPPTAAMCINDLFALYLLHAAREMGIAVPEDFSVIGFDNLPSCEHTVPRLTSIDQPMEEMGRYACKLLLEQIDGCVRPVSKVRVGLRLVHRGSTGPTSG
ncbi:MAG TPA: LacI family DNA-binding transcriptional regulator [Armatimonadota bacterium]|nr:LacI family DNA-binding transcriptional regulator [Armatimonadota bacterium]